MCCLCLVLVLSLLPKPNLDFPENQEKAEATHGPSKTTLRHKAQATQPPNKRSVRNVRGAQPRERKDTTHTPIRDLFAMLATQCAQTRQRTTKTTHTPIRDLFAMLEVYNQDNPTPYKRSLRNVRGVRYLCANAEYNQNKVYIMFVHLVQWVQCTNKHNDCTQRSLKIECTISLCIGSKCTTMTR